MHGCMYMYIYIYRVLAVLVAKRLEYLHFLTIPKNLQADFNNKKVSLQYVLLRWFGLAAWKVLKNALSIEFWKNWLTVKLPLVVRKLACKGFTLNQRTEKNLYCVWQIPGFEFGSQRLHVAVELLLLFAQPLEVQSWGFKRVAAAAAKLENVSMQWNVYGKC